MERNSVSSFNFLAVHLNIVKEVSQEGAMTVTKIVYCAAVILPFGFVVLAVLMMAQAYLSRRTTNTASSLSHSIAP